MISRKLSAKFVCLRCRSGLLGQAERFLFQPLLGSSGRRVYSLEATARSILQEDSEKTPKKERERPLKGGQKHEQKHGEKHGQKHGRSRDRKLGPRQPSDEDASQRPRRTRGFVPGGGRYADEKLVSDARAELIPPPPKRVYMARGHRMEVNQTKLPVNMLGKSVDTIVVREREKWKSWTTYEAQEHDEEKEKEVNPFNMESILAKEAGETGRASDSEAIRNIHGLRPKETVLSRDQFKKLTNALQRDFVNDQLREYKDHFLNVAGPKRLKQQPFFVLNKPLWTPLVEKSQETSMAPESEKSQKYAGISWYGIGYMESLRSPKEQLVMTIVRRCWGISRQDLNEGPGRIDAKLAEVQFSMLMLGTQRWVVEKTRHFLKPGERIELNQSEHMLSVIAPKSTAEFVMEEMLKVLKNTKTSSIPMSKIFPKRPEDLSVFRKELREVGQVTNTLTRMDREGKNVLVSWIDIRKHVGHWESSSDIVFRLLLHRHRGPKHSWAQLTDHCPMKPKLWPESSKTVGYYAPIPVSKESLSWLERSKEWARFVVPLSEEAADLDLPPLNSQLPFPVELGRQEGVVNKREWSPQSSILTKAVFGHLILDTSDLSHAKLLKRVYRPHLETAFLPIIPPLSSLDLPLADPQPSHSYLGHTIILLRFRPDASQLALPQIPGCLLPSLELRLVARRGDDDEILRVHSLRALIAHAERSISLPQGPVDLLIEQTSYFELDGDGIDGPIHPVAPIHDFLEQCDLRYAAGKLYVPPQLPRLRLPRRLLVRSDNSDDLVRVDYRFAGLETQDAVAADWMGFPLVHKSVNANPYGPRRAELSLEASPLSAWLKTEASLQPEKPQDASVAKDAFVHALQEILSRSGPFKWTGMSNRR